MKKYIYKTEEEVNKSFIEFLDLVDKELYNELVIGDQNDQNADIRTAYVDYIDSLEREGDISEELASTISFTYKEVYIL